MFLQPFRRSVLLAVLSAAALAGCASSDDDEDDDASAEMGSTVIGEMRVPKSAELVAQGRRELSHQARRDGRIWLHDATAEKTLFTTTVRRGQRFTIAPEEDRASLDGVDVFEGDMHTRNEHKIYYLPKP
jgi:type IV pilus biogenesis protein CpaD/CtpE